MAKVLVGVITYEGAMFCRDVFFKYLSSLGVSDFVFVTNSGEKDAADLRDRANVLENAEVLVNTSQTNRLDIITSNRNKIRDYFLAGDWEYLYFLDSDCVGPTNAIKVLLSHKKKLTTGWYLSIFDYTGKPQVLPVAYAFDKPGHARQLAIVDVLKPRVLPIAVAGLGCALIHRSILEKISFSRKKGGEDSRFFTQVREELGDKLWLDTRASFWHLKFPPGDKRNNLLDPRRYKLNARSDFKKK